MQVLKVLLPDDALELDDASLGAYIKLKALASQMTVKGVMVNGTVLTLDDIAQRAGWGEAWKHAANQLVEFGYLKSIDGVWCLTKSSVLFSGTVYAEDAIGRVVTVIRKTLKGSTEAILGMVYDAGSFKRKKTIEELRDEVLDMYRRFNADRSLVVGYIGLFRTKSQIETDTKMEIGKHHKLVQEVLEMYESEKGEYRGKEFTFTKEVFRHALDAVVQRQLTEVKNHNYLKVVLMNQKVPSEKRGWRGANEGY